MILILEQCAGAGLYLQGSDTQQTTQCTYLSQGYKYLSEDNSLYLNFYSRTSTVRGGFWIIFEGALIDFLRLSSLFCLFLIKANKPYAEVHLHCGPREKIGVPLSTPFPSVYNHGWSRLASPQLFDPAITMTANDYIKRLRLSGTTSHPLSDRDYREYSEIFYAILDELIHFL